MTDQSHQSLKTILSLDAATCAAMGIALVFASGMIAQLTGIQAPFLFWAGLLLLPIAVFMAVFARAAHVPGWAVQIIVAGNVLWVLGSLLLPMAGLISPNTLGWLFLILQAAVVAVFINLEWSARPQPAALA